MKIHLGGKGDPIPLIALPDPNLIGTLPSTIVEFEDTEDENLFDKNWWMDLGFTHYEVWCVGAAGGRGGSTGRVDAVEFHYYDNMPEDIWTAYKEARVLKWESGMSYELYNGVWWYQNGPSVYMGPGATNSDYWVHHADEFFPDRDPERAIDYKDPFIIEEYDGGVVQPPLYNQAPPPVSQGGGGGGGGTQVMNGALADLPDICPIIIGKAGADAGIGQVRAPGLWTPTKADILGYDLDAPITGTGYAARDREVNRIVNRWLIRVQEPLPAFPSPQPGGDGGASSFGGNVCQASGGKGGRPALIWVEGARKLDGFGGEGGVGGRLEAGGGAAGGKVVTVDQRIRPGEDGTWINRIGKGGGGGLGGVGHVSYSQYYGTARDATSGGRGTMSYADTSVHGKGGSWSYWTRRTYKHVFYDEDETLSPYPPEVTTNKWVPGGGGGVRILRKFPYGSRAEGYNPNGHVIIRLTKIG